VLRAAVPGAKDPSKKVQESFFGLPKKRLTGKLKMWLEAGASKVNLTWTCAIRRQRGKMSDRNPGGMRGG